MSTPCKYHATKGCTKGGACTFDHAIVDMAKAQGACTQHLLGSCPFGGSCKFTHKTIGDIRAAAAGGGGGGGGGKRHGGKDGHHGHHGGAGAGGLADAMSALALADKRPHHTGIIPASASSPMVAAAMAAAMAGRAGGGHVVMRTVREEVIITHGHGHGYAAAAHFPGGGDKKGGGGAGKGYPKERQVFEIALSFDTTGSMYSFLEQVKASIKGVVSEVYGRLARKSKDKAAAAAVAAGGGVGGAAGSGGEPRKTVRFAIIAHGDYCDADSSYVIKTKDFCINSDELKAFVDECGRTSGGDADECYELVLHKAGKLHWSPDAAVKALVMFGDANPHAPDYHLNKHHYDWRKEAETLKAKGVTVFPVHCGGSASTKPFYDEVARITGGHVLSLGYDRTPDVTQLITGICLKAASAKKFAEYEADLRASGARSATVFDQLASVRIVRSHMEVSIGGGAGGAGGGGAGAGARGTGHAAAAASGAMMASLMAMSGAGGGLGGNFGGAAAGALLDGSHGHHGHHGYGGGHGHGHGGAGPHHRAGHGHGAGRK